MCRFIPSRILFCLSSLSLRVQDVLSHQTAGAAHDILPCGKVSGQLWALKLSISLLHTSHASVAAVEHQKLKPLKGHVGGKNKTPFSEVRGRVHVAGD